MSFSFGANTTGNNSFGGGGFGATSNAGFGAAAPATTAFGAPAASTTTTFGTPAPTTTGFGAPATSTGFGAPSTGFGTSTTTSTFGTPAAPTTGLSFGGASAAPSIGITPAPATGLTFGANPAPTSTFGTSTAGAGLTFGASAAPSTTPSLFGTAAPTATTAPPYGTTTNTGFFGAKPAATTTGGLFGGAAKPAFGAPTTGGLFGSQPTNTLGGGFNTNTTSEQDRDLMIWRFLIKSEQEAQNATVDLLSSAEGSRPHNLWQALGNFQKKWDFKSPDCAFRYYFYNVVPAKDVHLYQKPADHDPRAWEEAQKANPDPTTMVPALAVGFEDVMKRMDQQDRLSSAHNNKLQEIEEKLKKLQVKDKLATEKKLAEYKKRHMELTQRALKFVKLVQLLRHKGYSITPDEEVMRTRYENIQDHLQRSEQFHGKLTQMWAQLQLIKESGRKYGQLGGVEGWGLVSQEDQDRITKILEEQDKGIQHLVEVIQKDTKEVDVLEEKWTSQPQ